MQIKAVPGIRACAVLDVGRREMYPMFPAIASPKYIENLADRLMRMSSQLQPSEQVEFQFDKQVCMVRRLVRGMIFVQGRSGFDAQTLKLTLGAVSSAIDRSLKTSLDYRGRTYDFTDPQYLAGVLEAFAVSKEFFREHLGLTMVTRKMQRARDNIVSLFPLLANFAVDQNGRVYAIKGQDVVLTASANEAFSRWLGGFVTSVWHSHPNPDEFDLRALTHSVSDALNDSNFYDTLADI